jgi:hypothetical protein
MLALAGSNLSVWLTLLIILLYYPTQLHSSRFTRKEIGQSNPMASGKNRISVTLVADASLAASNNSIVTITGLWNAQALTPLTLIDQGDDGETIFSDGSTQARGTWDAAAFTLTLAVYQGLTLMNDTTYTFAFDIENPSIAQTPPVIAIMASGSSVFSRSNMTSPNTAAKNVPNGANALYIIVPEFVVRRASQRTCMAGASNLLSITLKINMPLEHTEHCSPTIIIMPLTGRCVCVRAFIRVRA